MTLNMLIVCGVTSRETPPSTAEFTHHTLFFTTNNVNKMVILWESATYLKELSTFQWKN